MKQRTTILLTTVLALLITLHSQAQPPAEEILRTIRATSNKAIVERDLETLQGTWEEDVHVTASSGTVFQGSEPMTQAFRTAFEDPTFVTYLRKPTEISISDGGSFGAERGEWVGTWKKEDGEMKIRGVYLAQWRRHEGAWRIRSEVFVALSCTGSAECAQRRR